MSAKIRVLVIDGYDKAGREELQSGGASLAADLYVAMLRKYLPHAHYDPIFISAPGVELPVPLEAYAAIAWTGCSLTIFDDDPQVRRQIQLAKDAFEIGIPSFGSCWAAQIAVVAAGGVCRPNPHGREMGLGRKISLTPEGRAHPMYFGKPTVFDGFASHVDEVTHMPVGGLVLAGNAFTTVQAVAVTHKKGTFWGLQYHPEYDLHEMARLTYCRIEKLKKLGFFRTREDAEEFVELLETLHQDPTRYDLAWKLGIDEDITDPVIRQCEVRNWIEQLVIPH
ncbi:MAG: type 1 glutamine amidotransferase, partial [Proteobacteria bacterium]|nr:type 1 glutamine amidotransferase [Pseudomonadota bacterium]